VLEKMTSPTSASQRMESSLAFLKIPFRRLEKVTCRLVELSIRRITILPRPIVKLRPVLHAHTRGRHTARARIVMEREERERWEPRPAGALEAGFPGRRIIGGERGRRRDREESLAGGFASHLSISCFPSFI